MSRQLILPTAYWPSISYIQCLIANEHTLIEAHENYQKRTCRNRTLISRNQDLVTLSVPLKKGKHEGQSIKDVRISYEEAWQRQHIEAIKSCYGKAPYYDYYFSQISNLISSKEAFLWDKNIKILNWIQLHFIQDLRLKFTSTFLGVTQSIIESNQSIINYERGYPLGEMDSSKLSILDMIFHTGPELYSYLKQNYKASSN